MRINQVDTNADIGKGIDSVLNVLQRAGTLDSEEAAKAAQPTTGLNSDLDWDAFCAFEVSQIMLDHDANADGALTLKEFLAERDGLHRGYRFVSY
jgi:hypothetical protein